MGYRWKGQRLLSDKEFVEEAQLEGALIPIIVPAFGLAWAGYEMGGWALSIPLLVVGAGLGLFFSRFILIAILFGCLGGVFWFFYEVYKGL